MAYLVWGTVGALVGWFFIRIMFITRAKLIVGSFAFGIAGAILGGHFVTPMLGMKAVDGVPPILSVFVALGCALIFLYVYRLLLRGAVRW